jgi:methylenetetrahydrofolate reductase (NADPH)
MSLAGRYAPGRFGVSFEVYPPKTEAGDGALFRALESLTAFRPAFVSCTFGAGGSTRDQTLELICRIRDSFRVPVAAHRTCVEASAAEVRAWLRRAAEMGIESIVALRGDPPQGATSFTPPSDGFAHADDLVRFIRREFPGFGIAVAGYPEVHREAASPEADLAHLKRKVEAGADLVLTQLFYRNADFFAFRDRCAAAGIRVPIVPGILPILTLAQVQRITALCGAKLPDELIRKLEACADDPAGQAAVGVAHAVRQCEGLTAAGVPGLHFYVLNKAEAPAEILRALGVPCGAPGEGAPRGAAA